jgi:hypothetical protein
MNPHILFSIGILITGRTTEVSSLFDIWLLFGLVGSVISAPIPIHSVGKMGDYLSLTIIPSSVLIARSVTEAEAHQVLVLSLTLVAGALYIYSELNRGEARTEGMDELINFLNDKECGVVMVQPSHKARQIGWKTNHRILDSIMNDETNNYSIKNLFPEYLNFTEDTYMIRYRYNPDLVIFDKEQNAQGLSSPEGKKPEFKNRCFEVYRFNQIVG